MLSLTFFFFYSKGMQLASKEQEIDKPSSCSEHGSDYDGDGEGSSSLLSDDSSVAPIINHYHIHHHHHHIPAKISHDLAVQMVDLQHIGSKQDMETMVADASFSEGDKISSLLLFTSSFYFLF